MNTKEIDYGGNGELEIAGHYFTAKGTVEYLKTENDGDRDTPPTIEIEIIGSDVEVRFSDSESARENLRRDQMDELSDMILTRALEELERGEY